VIGWLDCTAGASGDMLLGAVVDAGVPLATLQDAVDTVAVEPIALSVESVTRGGLGATRVQVSAPRSTITRTWPDVRDLLINARLDEAVRTKALDVFARLAAAEARVHRVAAEQVRFHEVGALDAIADIVGVCAGLHALDLTSLGAGRVTLGSGVVRSEHGLIPVPAPAVLELLSAVSAPVWAGPAPYEMCTPTGAALLAAHVDRWGTLPTMNVSRTGAGAGRRAIRRRNGRMDSALTRWPSTASRAGRTVSAPTIATSTAAMPPKPIERRKTCGKISRLPREIPTVSPENATVRPAVVMVARSAVSTSPSAFGSSSRNLLTMNSA